MTSRLKMQGGNRVLLGIGIAIGVLLVVHLLT
jgi:hypothetical protein